MGAAIGDDKPNPVLREVASKADTLVLEGRLAGFLPGEVFDYWTKPDLIVKWWPEKAEIEPRVGGAYRLSWPGMDWTLRGEITAFEPGKRLAFTWRWDHEPKAPPRTVTVTFAPHPDAGTAIRIAHGPYGASEAEQAERKGHIEGWQGFCARLQEFGARKGE